MNLVKRLSTVMPVSDEVSVLSLAFQMAESLLAINL